MNTRAKLRLHTTLEYYREVFDEWALFNHASNEAERLVALRSTLAVLESLGAQWLFTMKEPTFKKWLDASEQAQDLTATFGVCTRFAWNLLEAAALELLEMPKVVKWFPLWLERGHDDLLKIIELSKIPVPGKRRGRKPKKHETPN